MVGLYTSSLGITGVFVSSRFFGISILNLPQEQLATATKKNNMSTQPTAKFISAATALPAYTLNGGSM